MKVTKIRKRHQNGFLVKFWSLDLNVIFKKRDADWFNSDRNYCIYLWCRHGVAHYIGEGRLDTKFWQEGRPFNHKDDMLTNTIGKKWKCEILACGLSKKEAGIIEAYLLKNNNRTLSKRNQYTWDGVSLINKQREYTYKGERYEELFEKYLNLDNGNNYWEALRRKINGNQR